MSIQSEISRIKTNIANALNAVAAKGVTVPVGANSDNLAELISKIGAVEPTYTNLLPISVDTDGSIYNGKGFSTGYLSSGVVTSHSSRCVTGFMPIGYGSANTARGEQVIHFADINVPEGDNYTRVSFYTADKTHISTQNGVSFKATDDGQASSIYTASNGMIKTVDVTGYTAYLRNNLGKTPAFFRVSVPGATGIDDSSIITVNEPIE